MSEQIEIRSKELLSSVTQGLDFSVPNVDFNDSAFVIPESLAEALQNTPDPLTVDSLTECVVDGEGCFDKVMTALKAHLNVEYDAGRITGSEYTKAYIASMQGALQFSVQYLLGKDNAHFSALGAQAASLRANVEAYTAKAQLAIAQAQAHMNKAQYAVEVLKLGATDTQRDLVIEQAKQVIAQTSLTGAQQSLTTEQVKTQEKQTTHLGKQTELVTEQIGQTVAQTALVGAQTNTQKQQEKLLKEQTEQAHAQVSDTQTDGKTAVTGYIGDQKSLLKQQVVSFKKDSIIKSAKIYADSFATQLSMSTATAEGTGLDANGIGNAMSKLANSMNS